MLCTQCQDFFAGRSALLPANAGRSSEFVHHVSLESFARSVDAECHVCNLIAYQFQCSKASVSGNAEAARGEIRSHTFRDIFFNQLIGLVVREQVADTAAAPGQSRTANFRLVPAPCP